MQCKLLLSISNLFPHLRVLWNDDDDDDDSEEGRDFFALLKDLKLWRCAFHFVLDLKLSWKWRKKNKKLYKAEILNEILVCKQPRRWWYIELYKYWGYHE